MGLGLAVPGFHTRSYVEWEQYPRDVLVAAQRAGYLAPAPIWDDLKTFDARPLAGAIDTVLAGYPCQPFSAAGQRRGEADERHLWPDVARVCRELGGGLRWIVLENVAGHVTLGAETVLRELWDMGFTPAAGIFTAAEVGATHRRERWFCVAYRSDGIRREDRRCADCGEASSGCETEGREIREGMRVASDGRSAKSRAKLAHPDGGHSGAERQQRGGEQRFQPKGRGAGGGDVGKSGHPRRREIAAARDDADRNDTIRPEGHGRSREPGGDVVDPKSVGRGEGRAKSGIRIGRDAAPAGAIGAMADAGQPGPQGKQRGERDQVERQDAPRSSGSLGQTGLFPPGPSDAAAWAAVLRAAPSRAPALARRDAAAAALRLASLLSAHEAHVVLHRAGPLASIDELVALVSEAGRLVVEGEAFAGFRGVADGLAARARALKLLGNGVVPLEAGHAVRTLLAAHGVRSVDMEAPGEVEISHATEPLLTETTP